MGAEVERVFLEIERVAGVVGKVRLAALARITSAEARTVPDTPELVARVAQAAETLRRQLPGATPTPRQVALESPRTDADVLRRHLKAYLDLISQRELFFSHFEDTVHRVTETAADVLGVERVSVWLLEDSRSKIVCSDLFQRSVLQHSSGTELHARDYAPYFAALSSERTIAAHDAHTDPRTSCFAPSYLAPLGIRSMLDVPIWTAQRMVGVICHEHVGAARTWDADEEQFAYLMSNVVALALERRTFSTRPPRSAPP